MKVRNVRHARKYKFTGETMEFEGHILRRIQYVRNVTGATESMRGGWIESEKNLPHHGKSSVLNDAKVYGHAVVIDDAWVGDNAIIKDNAIIREESRIYGNAIIGADTIIGDTSCVKGTSQIFFYHDLKHVLKDGEEYRKPAHICADSIISRNTIIEATGYIVNSSISNQNLFGSLIIKHEYLKDS